MGRGCITYSISFIAGILAGNLIAPGFWICTPLLAIFTFLLLMTKKKAAIFLAIAHLALFTAGVQAIRLSMDGESLPPHKLASTLRHKAGNMQDIAENFLKGFTSTPQNHATLCALAVGIKAEMSPSSKKAYSKAGAMHLLALSGLHAGIIFSIFNTLSVPLGIMPGGGSLRIAFSMLFLLLYMVVSGCTPSVVRACTMIFLYKISAKKFRSTRNWDAIALSALITGALAPQEVTGIGFQLSYAAVIGIAALYPTCRKSFMQYTGNIGAAHGIVYKIALLIWENISLSLCCQLATLPLILYHFGESAQFFLITNLMAIPLVTCILYLTTAAIMLHWIPLLGPFLIKCLNVAIELLDSSIQFISG